jgi:Tol biopolymer transport system component
VSGDARSGVAYFGVSKTGSLVYALGLSVQGAREIVWADRSGRREPAGIPSGNYTGIALSPDGRKVAYAAGPGGGARSDIWIADLVHSSHFQLTSTGQAQSPCWTPDGSSVIFATPLGDILRQRADGSSAAEVLWRTPYRVPAAPDSFVPDGSALLFTVSGLPSRADLFLLPLSGERKARVLISTPEAEHQAMISPNGRWLAYAGEYEAGARIYVQPYPSLAGRWLIAPTGGAAPRWSRDGKELVYMWNDQIFAVSIAEGATFTPGEPRPVFKIERPADLEWNDIYDVAPDGKFLLLQRQKEANQSSRLDVVLNFSKTLAAGDSKAP